MVQGLFGALAVLLIFAVTARIFDACSAAVASLIAAVYLNFIVYGVTLDPNFHGVYRLVLVTAVLVSGLGSRYKSILCGVIVGLGTMMQPHFLFLAPGLLVILADRKAFLGTLALVLLPFTIRNSIMSGSPVPVYPASVFGLGLENFLGLEDRLAVVDKLYNNAAVLLSRGWDKQQRIDLAGIVYMARYGYVLLMLAGLAGLIRYYRKEQKALLYPVLGYFLVLALLSRFVFEQRSFVEPLLVIYAGVLVTGAGRHIAAGLRRALALGK
jgi:hypothetical protein